MFKKNVTPTLHLTFYSLTALHVKAQIKWTDFKTERSA